MAFNIKDKVAIVTGGGKGIGKSMCKILSLEGAKILVVVGHREEDGKKVVDEIKNKGREASYIVADIIKKSDMERMAKTCIERYGRIDILCQNAGIYNPKLTIEDMTEEQWDRVIDTNLKGTFLAVQACLPQMKTQNYGKIVVTSSITGPITANIGLSHYASSKGGVTAFVKTAAIELAKYNINVNALQPGNIMTEGMGNHLGDDYIKAQEAAIPMGKLGEPEDVAYTALFLASDEAKYITGQTIVIDGGQTIPESRLAVR